MQSLFIAFAMYSRIPVPEAEWNDKNKRYAFCWFPLIGLIIGGLEVIALFLLDQAGVGSLLRGAVLTCIPLVVTGGIHLDGFMDTSDARSSWGDREKKLAILKDSHIGAFAVIKTAIYLILTLGLWSEMGLTGTCVMIPAFALERALSAFMAVTLKGAREDGMLADFEKSARKQTVGPVLILEALVCAVLMVLIAPVMGIFALVAAIACLLYYRHMAMKEFGGITGDLAGWFLQNCELWMLAAILAGSLIRR